MPGGAEPSVGDNGRQSFNGTGGRVRAETCGEPLSLAHIPVDQVIRLVGLTDDQLAVSLDPLPDGSPVVIRYRIPHPSPSTHDVVDDVLAKLESIAIDLFPAWLPSADAIDTSSDFDRRVVRRLAHRRVGGKRPLRSVSRRHGGGGTAWTCRRIGGSDPKCVPRAWPRSSPTVIAVTVSCCASDPAMLRPPRTTSAAPPSPSSGWSTPATSESGSLRAPYRWWTGM